MCRDEEFDRREREPAKSHGQPVGDDLAPRLELAYQLFLGRYRPIKDENFSTLSEVYRLQWDREVESIKQRGRWEAEEA